MNEQKIIKKLEKELNESEHTIHILMNAINEKDRQISDLSATVRIMAETIDEMKNHIACITECDCCCECDESDCDEFDCEKCDCGGNCEDECNECPEIAPCGRSEDERCCIFCDKVMDENALDDEMIEDETDSEIDTDDDDAKDVDFFDFIGNLVNEIEKNPDLKSFEKDGFEVYIKRIK